MSIEEAVDKLKWALRNNTIVDVESAYEYICAIQMAIQTFEAIPKIRARLKEWGEDACVKEHGCCDEVMEIIDRYLPKE